MDVQQQQLSQGQRQIDLQAARDREDALTGELTRRAAQQNIDLGRLGALGDVAIESSGMDPELAGLGRKYGRMRSMPATPPEFPAIEPPAMLQDTREMYVPPAFAKEEDARTRLSQALAKIRPDMSELEKAGILQGAGGIQSIPEEAFAAPRRVVPIPPGSITPTEIGPRDLPLEMNYPPQPAAAFPKLFQAFDKDSDALLGTVPLAPHEYAAFVQQNPNVVLREQGFKPTVEQVPATTLNELNRARDIWLQEPDSPWWPGEPQSKAAARQRYEGLLGAAFATFASIDPTIKETAIGIAIDPELAGLSTYQAIAHPKFQADWEGEPLTPEEIQQLDRLLSIVRGVPSGVQ